MADASAIASFGAIEEAIGRSLSEDEDQLGAEPGIDVDDEEYEGLDFRLAELDEDGISVVFKGGAIPGVAAGSPRPLDVSRLQGALRDLIACRQLLDSALKEG